MAIQNVKTTRSKPGSGETLSDFPPKTPNATNALNMTSSAVFILTRRSPISN